MRFLPEQPEARASLRKVILFLLLVMIFAGIYQVIAFQYILPNRPIHWREGNLTLLAEFEKQKRRLSVLVMLEADVQTEIDHQLAIFEEPEVRAALNRLRSTMMLLPVVPRRDEDRKWLDERNFDRIPILMIYAAGYDQPVRLSLDVPPATLAKQLDDVRFRRYEP